MPNPRKAGTQHTVIGRALAVLGEFGPGASLSLNEISERAGLPLSTTFRLVQELHDGRILARGADRRYRVGPRVHELAG